VKGEDILYITGVSVTALGGSKEKGLRQGNDEKAEMGAMNTGRSKSQS